MPTGIFIHCCPRNCGERGESLVGRNKIVRPIIHLAMFTQLNPPIPLDVIGKGSGYAVGLIDYGQEHNLIWVTALSDSGEIWCAPNPSVRMQKNWTMGRVPHAATPPNTDTMAARPS